MKSLLYQNMTMTKEGSVREVTVTMEGDFLERGGSFFAREGVLARGVLARGGFSVEGRGFLAVEGSFFAMGRGLLGIEGRVAISRNALMGRSWIVTPANATKE